MNVIEARRRPTDVALTTGAPVLEPTVVSPAVVVDAESRAPVLVTARYPGELTAYRQALLAYPMDTTLRTGGIRNISRSFGFLARSPVLQRNSCRSCNAAADAPEAHAVICAAAGRLADELALHAPEVAGECRRRVHDAVRPDWFVHPAGWWTSGVVNLTSPLPYHRDGNNFDGAWSAMVVVRRGVRGGHLHVPEYGLVVACRDGDVVWFNGSDLIHGVTPMRKVDPSGYRISAVYYPVSAMAKCLDFEEELARGRAARSAAEDDMIARQRANGALTS